jgi:hypothetical protein
MNKNSIFILIFILFLLEFSQSQTYGNYVFDMCPSTCTSGNTTYSCPYPCNHKCTCENCMSYSSNC